MNAASIVQVVTLCKQVKDGTGGIESTLLLLNKFIPALLMVAIDNEEVYTG